MNLRFCRTAALKIGVLNMGNTLYNKLQNKIKEVEKVKLVEHDMWVCLIYELYLYFLVAWRNIAEIFVFLLDVYMFILRLRPILCQEFD
jgi:polyferredoxin